MKDRRVVIKPAARAVLFAALMLALCPVSPAASPQWRVRAVEFTGNNTFNRRTLQNFMELKAVWPGYGVRYTDFMMRSDIETLRAFYRSRGFERAEIATPKIVRDSASGHVRIHITINEGPRTIVNDVKIDAARFKLTLADEKKLLVKRGMPLIHAEVWQDARVIKEALGLQGFLEATVEPLIFFDTAGTGADIIYKINEGPKVIVGEIILDGHTGVADNAVLRELAFRSGDTLNLDVVRRSERRLYTTTLFNFAQVRTRFERRSEETGGTRNRDAVSAVPPDVAAADSAAAERRDRVSYPDGVYDVRVRVTPGDFFRMQAGAGFSTDECANFTGLEFYECARLSVRTSYRNLFRHGHAITLDGKISQVSQRAEAIYYVPRIPYMPFYFESKVYYNRYDNVELYQGVFNGIRFAAGRQTDYDIHYQLWTQLENVEWIRAPAAGGDGPVGLPDYPTQSIGGDIGVDLRNDYFNPTEGSYHNLGLEIAGVFGGESNQFIRATFDTRWYFNHRLRYFWSSALRAGYAEPYGRSEIVPVQRQFFGGGSSTVRGFDVNRLAVTPDDDPLKGNFYIFANIIDFRFPLVWWFNGAAFIDAGNVWTNFDDIGSIRNLARDLRWSVGPGLRVDTPIKLAVRLDLGFKLDRRPGESAMVWHFDLGQPF